jgi:hypothetical protein
MVLETKGEGRPGPNERQETQRTLHVFRLDDQQVEFRFLSDSPGERRSVPRGVVVGLPANAGELDRFEVVVTVVRREANAPEEIVGVRIVQSVPEVTLNDVFGPHLGGIAALGGTSEHVVDRVIRDQRDWYRALQLRPKKMQ